MKLAPSPAVSGFPLSFRVVAAVVLLAASLSALPSATAASSKLTFTTITEVTDAGKNLRPAAPATSIYYITKSQGPNNRGDTAKEATLSADQVEKPLVDALAKSRYVLSGSEAQKPALAIFYMWGSHNVYDPDASAVSEDTHIRNNLDRAALIGGRQFAADLAKAYRDTESIGLGSPHIAQELPEHLRGSGVGIVSGMSQMNTVMSPLRLLALRSQKHQLMLDQASRDCYYVVVSAYDYASTRTKSPVLLWRTRMTVSASGVSQRESLPRLIEMAGPFFGREMKEPEIVTIR